jgi:N-acetylmuramoyl-L-alanine amidase
MGPDPGALSVMGEKGVYESEINYATCAVLVDKLMNLGADVTFIYTGDEKLDSESRMSPAHDVMADFYICVHANAIAESADANLYFGTEVYYHEETSRRFAELFAAYISTATGRDNEEAHQDYYTVTRMTYCPSVMIETGYLSNPAELESLTDPMMIERTAWAVVRAVTEILE